MVVICADNKHILIYLVSDAFQRKSAYLPYIIDRRFCIVSIHSMQKIPLDDLFFFHHFCIQLIHRCVHPHVEHKVYRITHRLRVIAYHNIKEIGEYRPADHTLDTLVESRCTGRKVSAE